MPATPLHALHDAGQSLWLDYIDRTLVRSGELARRIQGDALTGMTSNPTIFDKAIREGEDCGIIYDHAGNDMGGWNIC